MNTTGVGKITALRVYRVRKGFSLGQVAKAMGVTKPSVSAWEAGRRTPSIYDIIKLADFYGTDVNEIAKLIVTGENFEMNV